MQYKEFLTYIPKSNRFELRCGIIRIYENGNKHEYLPRRKTQLINIANLIKEYKLERVYN